MEKYFHSVTLDEDKCRGCTNCIKRCPTEAIRVRKSKARIINERCIDCGECLRVCPYHAKKAITDPAVISFLMEKEKMSIRDIDEYLNKKSGVLGISGVSSDFRDLHAAANDGNGRAKLSIDIFCYGVKKFIGEYAAVMGGVDAIIFTAGVGENDPAVRKYITEGLDFLGIAIDDEKNSVRGEEADISAPDAKVKTLVIPTNEELAIARETLKLVK